MNRQVNRRGLRSWMLGALVLGAFVGGLLRVIPRGAVHEIFLDGVCYAVGGAFLTFVALLAVPLFITSVACGTSSMGDARALGGKGIKLMVLYVATTAAAVCIALALAFVIRPGGGMDIFKAFPEAGRSISAFVSMLQSQLHQGDAVGTVLSNGVLWMLVFSMLVGVVLARLKERVEVVTNFLRQLNDIMLELTMFALRLAPVAILCLTARVVANLGAACVAPLVLYLVVVLLALAIQCFVVDLVLLTLSTGLRPFKFLRKISSVVAFAFSTATSSATVSMMIDTLEGRVGVPRRISSYTIPLGVATNMDGTAIMQGVAVVFVAQACGMELSLLQLVMVAAAVTIASLGGAGVPGVGLVGLSLMLAVVGLPVEGIGLILGIDRLLDKCRTAVNIVGDMVCTTIVASQAGELDHNVFDKRADA